jgi:hypothetical protein
MGYIAKVSQNGKCGIIDKVTGREIIPIQYDDIRFDDFNAPFEGLF